MNLLLLGATGRVGSRILTQALADGHHVTAFVRNLDKLQLSHPALTVFHGDARNQVDIERAMRGADAVISTLSTDGGTTLTDSMPWIIAAMKTEHVHRIITVGTAGILQSRVEPDKLRYQSSEATRALTRATEEHHKAYEMLATSGLDWTVVCPTYLPDEEPLGHYRVERDFLPDGGKKIAVGDTAELVYQQLTSDQYLRARVGVAY